MPYTADDAANDVVTRFQTVFYGPDATEAPLIQFQAENSAEIGESLVEESGTYSVFVFADSETSTPLDRDDVCDESLVVGVVVTGPISDTVTKNLAMKFCKQLRRALRNTYFEYESEAEDVLTKYRWMQDQTDALFDAEAMASNSRFVGAFNATFQGYA